MHKRFKQILFFLFCFLPLKIFAAPSFDQLVVFGDSLSDTGRIYSIFSNAHKAMPLIPVLPKSPPYYQGRFSNGPVWVEDLSASLKLEMVNYALGGSLAESFWESGVPFPWSFDTMLDQYLTDHLLDKNKSKHLFVIWGGGNDYLNDRDDVDNATTKTVNSIKRYIDKLAFFGATHILVLNIPDLGKIPFAGDKGPDTADHMSLLSQIHNFKLAKMIKAEKEKYAGKVEILSIDANYYFADILLNPAKYQLKDVGHACYTGGFTLNKSSLSMRAINETMSLDLAHNASLRTVYLNSEAVNPEICNNPDAFLFWDAIHPTQAAHRIISARVGEALRLNGWVD